VANLSSRNIHGRRALVALVLCLTACGGQAPTSPSTALPVVTVPVAREPAPVQTSHPLNVPSDSAPILVGAGDIGDCESEGAEKTAELLDQIPGLVFTAGDNGQGTGSAEELARCYDPHWGRHKGRTLPVPGNHDYNVPGASDYFNYFGERAGPAGQGYFARRIGADWLFVSLNSEIPVGPGSPQQQWLRDTLRRERARCIVAAWHQPFVSSGPSRGTPRMGDLWRVLQEHGADIVLQGHDHFYERFVPVTADEQIDAVNGIRSFIVGTGGGRLIGILAKHPASAARARTWGVLKIYLQPTGYEWEFLSAGGGVLDRGRDGCRVDYKPPGADRGPGRALIPSDSSGLPW
jgi:hypothetical protein